jgi:hypothetical protein
MKHIKDFKLNEDKSIDGLRLESIFSNLTEIDNFKESIEFLSSLNLTKEQYNKLEEIMNKYGEARYDSGFSSGLDSMTEF